MEKREFFSSSTTAHEFSAGSAVGASEQGTGLSVEQLAEAKRLPPEFLQDLGLTTVNRQQRSSVRIPYFDSSGDTIAVRSRKSLTGRERFAWRKGDRVDLYGLQRLDDARKKGWVIIVEGESDCWAAWFHDLPAIGVPGKSIWRENWAELLDGLDVYIWQEPDAEDFSLRVAAHISTLRIIVAPPGLKDLSEAHWFGVDLPRLLEDLRKEAIPSSELLKARDTAKYEEISLKAAPILATPDPLQRISEEIRSLGYGGDLQTVLIVYLAMTSRVLAVRPGTMLAHLLLVGPAGAGKSYAVQVVRRLLPKSAVVVIDAGSPGVLIYMKDNLKHQALIYSEADSLPASEDSPIASAIRNLLQDNQLSYKVTRQDPRTGDYGVQDVTKEGPTVVITTAVKSLGPQLTTRFFTVDVPDDPSQMRAALSAQGKIEVEGVRQVDESVVAFQELLQLGAPWDVIVPFAPELSAAIGRLHSAPRILRDYQRLLALIKAATVIRHQHRLKDANGRLVATRDDYCTVRELTNHMYEGSISGASTLVRETVEAVNALIGEDFQQTVNGKQIADFLGINKSSVSRRVEKALEEGWLVNLEPRHGQPQKLVLGDPLPKPEGLPQAEDLDIT